MKVHLKKDNSGAAMLTVVIAILFIVALGVALLSASYLGYAVTLTQEKSKANLYDAEAAMDDIRTGVHNVASNALADAYTQTLRDYALNNGTNLQTDFANRFVNNLMTPKYGLVVAGASANTYSAKALAAFADGTKASTLTVNDISAADVSAGSGNVVCTPAYDAKSTIAYTSFTLKNVKLVFIDKKNYETDISTDISISVPSFKISASTPYTAKKYTVIANQSLSKAAGGSSSITGDVFVGSGGISATGNSNVLSFVGGDVVTSGATVVDSDASFHFGEASGNAARTLWTQGIKISDGGSFVSQGSGTAVKVANDLSVKGSNCSVTLAGSYTGFGSETASKNAGGTANKDASSSILIGGKNTTFNSVGLTSLTLGGVAFINQSTQASGSTADIPMGQSVAVQTDQLAYLVPPSCLGSGYPTNPYYYAADSAKPTLSVRTDKPLWPNCSNPSYSTITLTKYLGASQPTGHDTTPANKYYFPNANVEARYSQSGIAYVFLYFKSQSMANQYFKDYLSANPDNISQYLSYYLADGKLNINNVTSAGTTYSYSSTEAGATPDQKDANLGVSVAGPAALYAAKTEVSPYDSIVKNTSDIKGNMPMQFKDSSGKVVAVVTNTAFNYSRTEYPDLHLILCTGTVTGTDAVAKTAVTITANETFNGVVIAAGTVAANGTIDPTGIKWTELLSAKSGDIPLAHFIGGVPGTTGTATDNEWDLDDLIVYKNWHKS